MDDRKLTPREVRKLIREEKITGSDFRLVSGICTGKSSDPSQRSGL